MRRFAIFYCAPLALGLTGCVSVATTVVTAPFKIAGAAIDLATTSQAEADRNRGRAIRKQEEAAAKAARKQARLERACRADYTVCTAKHNPDPVTNH